MGSLFGDSQYQIVTGNYLFRVGEVVAAGEFLGVAGIGNPQDGELVFIGGDRKAEGGGLQAPLVVPVVVVVAGYRLQENPYQRAGGKYRFLKGFDEGDFGLIDFQALVYSDTMWSAGAPSRFKVQLTRSPDRHGLASGGVTRGLSQLVVEDFAVAILPAADHWWAFQDTDSLGAALAEAGHLIVGYGMPWLAGDLLPPGDSRRLGLA